MTEQKLTIRQIAQMAGVSETAVSFVINNRKGVSEQTRARVHEIISKTQYVPNKNSQRLSMKKSFNVCLATNPNSSPFSDFFYNDVAKGIVEQSAFYNYNIILAQLSYDEKGNCSIPMSVKNRDADGIIFLQDAPDALLNRIADMGVPIVLVDAFPSNRHFVTINTDAEQSAYIATRYLIEKGHKEIGFIGSDYLPRYYTQTTSGFMRAMAESGLTVRPNWFDASAMSAQTSYSAMEKMLLGGSHPTAMFCAGDIYAIGAINCANTHGYSVPGDISFIGLDNIVLSSYFAPPLTTIGYDSQTMGKLAMDSVIRLIGGEVVESVQVSSDRIIERKSVRRI